MKTYWLSFADEDSGRNLGVCVVQVSDEHVAEAVEVATRVNPEGYPGDDWVLAAIGRSRLMVPSRTESASRFRQGRRCAGIRLFSEIVWHAGFIIVPKLVVGIPVSPSEPDKRHAVHTSESARRRQPSL
jgi:hypothetical protein